MCGAASRSTLEVPVTIRNPDKPIGTHVFTAVARTDAGSALDGGHDRQRRQTPRTRSTASTFPQDVLDRIAPTALPRSSLIISDEPLNRETNYRTEFVVVLNNQPQGGLAIRRRPDEVRVARRGWDDGGYNSGRYRGGWGSPYGGYGYSRRGGYYNQW